VSESNDIAHRHLLPANGIADAAGLKTFSVRVIVDNDWAASVAGQLLVSSLVNLLCRQAKVVSRVEIIAQDVRLLILLPSGKTAAPFPACLEELGTWAAKDAVVISAGRTDAIVDFTIIVGCGDTSCSSTQGYELVALGDGWRAWVGERSHAPTSVSPGSTNPIGPFLAASLIAGEVFKRSRGILRGRYLTNSGFSIWSGQSLTSWHELEDGPELVGRVLPPIHVVGTGAVGNDLTYVIASAQLGEAYLVLIDDDSYDNTNLNRCLLAGWQDVGHRKVEAVARVLTAAKVDAFQFPSTIKEYIVDSKIGLRADVAARVDQLEFDIVMSCVDKGTSRQDVQGLWPKLLLGGSTLGLQAKANVYRLRAGAACLACHNPAEQDGERLRELEFALRNMPVDERRQFLMQRDLPVGAVEEYLAGADCGTLGEAALNDFATRPQNQFSIGFVSLGAAVLLGAALFRHTTFARNGSRRTDMTTLNYLNGGLYDSGLGVVGSCQLRCSEKIIPTV
jgi:molybdopterin/thiamine biosynthesis adenylyltransferase